MAINNKFVHFKTSAKFNEELSAGNILDTSICWIKDTKQIWAHGQFYDCSSLTDEDIVRTTLVGYTESVETNENLDLTAEDTIVGAFGKLVKAIKDNEEVDSAAFVKLRDSVGLDENLGFSTSAGDSNVTEAIERIDGKIISTGNGSKFLSNDGTYKEVSDTIINIDSIDGYTGTLLGITYSEIVDCIKKNNNIKVKIENVNGINSNLIFTPISCTYIEESNTVMISIDVSLAYSNLYTTTVLLMISNDNSCAIAFVNKTVSCGDLSNNGDIAINLLYRGVEGQKETSTNMLLKKTGDGTKFLSDDGQYKKIGTLIEAVGSSGAITQELSPNKYYKFGRCTSLTITLGAEVSGILNEYMFEFISGVTATVLNLPETVKWNNGNTPTIEANKKYIVSIVSNIAVIGGA